MGMPHVDQRVFVLRAPTEQLPPQELGLRRCDSAELAEIRLSRSADPSKKDQAADIAIIQLDPAIVRPCAAQHEPNPYHSVPFDNCQCVASLLAYAG